MRPFLRKGLFVTVFISVFSASGSASPLSSRLISLVPPGAEIVAGFENHAASNFHGRLLLATRNNRLDLEDFESLTGVDSKRSFDEVIEVAASPTGGALSEHLLLVAGRFDRERIFRSMELNGAKSTQFLGERILLIAPLSRERGDMLDTRWFVILNNQTAIFGTPGLAQKALRRYGQHAIPDPVLEERLSLLRRDVNSWNIIAGSKSSRANISFSRPNSAWAQLQQDADVLMVAARFGARVRVDFSIHADSERGAEFFSRKAEYFTNALNDSPAVPRLPADDGKRRLQNLLLEPNRVQGSMEMSSKEFAAWCDNLFLARAGVAVATGD